MSANDGKPIRRAKGIHHPGTAKFINKVVKGRKKSKAAKKARRKQR